MLSLSESVLLTNANLPWTLLLAMLARGLLVGQEPLMPRGRTRLAPQAGGAYLTRSRIASQYAHGRRPFPVR